MHNIEKSLEPLAGIEIPSLKDFWKWVEKTFTPSYQSEIEAHLAGCVDHADVERRITNLIRRGMI